MGWGLYHWVREWSAPEHQTMWIELQTTATVFAFGAAFRYVVLTARLLRETAASRETDLMLRLIREYDGLRQSIVQIRAYYRDCETSGQEPMARFRAEYEGMQRLVDDARFDISRFFVRVRKLSQSGYLSERVIIAALDPEAIERVFLALVDPLDEVKAGADYKHDDRDVFTALLRRYREGGA